jgi:hypothetical protein
MHGDPDRVVRDAFVAGAPLFGWLSIVATTGFAGACHVDVSCDSYTA